MPYLQRLKHDLKAGWAALRYGTVQAANRALEETELLRLRLEVRKLDERLRESHRDIGERVMELHDRGELVDRILSDPDVMRSSEQAMALKVERAKLLREMDDARSVD